MRILFFFLTGERTGSEMVLYNMIANADRRRIEMGVACGRAGELLRALPPDVPVFDYSAPAPLAFAREGAGARRLYNRALNGLYHRAHGLLYGRSPVPIELTREERILRVHEEFRPDFWYVNTLAQPHLLRIARARGIPCVLHSMELEQMLWPLPPGDVENIVSHPRLVIALSEAAADVLRLLGRAENVEVCYGSVDVSKVRADAERSAAVRRGLGIRDDAFVWAMSGTLDPNKNPARFVELAREVSAARPDSHFMWIGGAENGYSMFVKAKAEALGVADRVAWVPARSQDYYDHLNVADGFVLTSDRDSLGLVVIEAAALGKPVVSFDSGGVREILRPGMGVVVRGTWNAPDLARAMSQVMGGEVAFDPLVSKGRAAEFDVSAQVGRWQGILENYLAAA